jgi:transcriptional regulator with XRE-family HTH domain
MKIGERIKLLRLLAGITQVDVSRHLDISQHNIAMLEKGRYKPRLSQAESLSTLFGCSVDWLLFGKIPAFPVLGYAIIPPKIDISRKKFNEIDDALRTLFVDFLKENEVKEYTLITSPSTTKERSVYVFYLPHNALFLLMVEWIFHQSIVNVIEQVISENKIQKIKESIIDNESSSNFFSGDIIKSCESMSEIFKNIGIDDPRYIDAYRALKNRNIKREWVFTCTLKIRNSAGISEEEAYQAILDIESAYYNSPGAKRLHILDAKLQQK